MQMLFQNLDEHGYVEQHVCFEGPYIMKGLFFTHLTSLQLLRYFPHMLIVDCTYKTNRFKYPLLEIVGVTSTSMTFIAVHAFLAKEKMSDYEWALRQLRELLVRWTRPGVILTGRDQALIRAVEEVFPSCTHLLCGWHVNKNVHARTRELFSNQEDYDIWYGRWMDVVHAST
ncbi:hypothetical protein Scep_021641 [Stephania cephalantha]|uniref:MULE transposase domain-containing protein n=1 Tax=Stephania cephalantha TaxID=152367 RepID=A0AAP0F6H7_9MAGN